MASGFWDGGEIVGQIGAAWFGHSAADLFGYRQWGRIGSSTRGEIESRGKAAEADMTICGRAMRLVQWAMACWVVVTGAAMAQSEAPQFPFPPSPVEGVWRAQLESEVTIQVCELGYCGFLTRIVVPSEGLSAEELAAAQAMSPEQFFDYRNENPELRNRPMQDLHLLTLRPGNKPTIFDGEIYNPQDGKTYSGYVELTGPDSMRLNGCVLYNVICRGEDWVWVPQAELDARLAAEQTAQ